MNKLALFAENKWSAMLLYVQFKVIKSMYLYYLHNNISESFLTCWTCSTNLMVQCCDI